MAVQLVLCIGLLPGCTNEVPGDKATPVAGAAQARTTDPSGAGVPAPSTGYSYRVIAAAEGTFGYEILRDGTPYIRQTTIPGRPGVGGCITQEQAERLALLVLIKLKRNILPPTVTPAELDSLGIDH